MCQFQYRNESEKKCVAENIDTFCSYFMGEVGAIGRVKVSNGQSINYQKVLYVTVRAIINCGVLRIRQAALLLFSKLWSVSLMPSVNRMPMITFAK